MRPVPRHAATTLGRATRMGCAALAVAACGGTGAGPASGAQSAPCHPNVRYVSAQGGAGDITAVFKISVVPGSRCELRGYPWLELLGPGTERLTTHEIRSGAVLNLPVRRVVVTARRPGRFVVEYHTIGADGRVCHPRPVALAIRLPSMHRETRAAVNLKGPRTRLFIPCNGQIIVSPVASLR